MVPSMWWFPQYTRIKVVTIEYAVYVFAGTRYHVSSYYLNNVRISLSTASALVSTWSLLPQENLNICLSVYIFLKLTGNDSFSVRTWLA